MSMMSALYDIVNIMPLSLLLMMIFGSDAGIPVRSFPAVMICVGFTALLIALRNMKLKNRLRGTGIAAVFAAGLLIAAGEEHRQVFFDKHLWVIWVICFCFGAMAAELIMYKSIWLRRAAALGFLAYALAGIAIKELGVGKEIFALICFVVLVRLTEEIQRSWVKSGSPDINEHITRVSPFIAALCLIVYLIPAPAKPFGWEFAKDIFNRTVSALSRIFGSSSDSSDDYGMIGFSDGLMRRRDFSGFLLAECALYFAGAEDGLKKIYRPVPFYEAYSARTLIEQLMLGPQPFDSQSGLSAVLPQGLRPADLLGVAYEEQTMLVNFSANLPALCQGMEESAERALIYALTDTLCELPGVRRAALFIQGEQPETLAGGIYLPGDFLPSADASGL